MRKLFILLVISVLPLLSRAQTKVEIDGLWYALSDTSPVAEVISSQGTTSYSGKVVIPSSVTYNSTEFKVTSIAERAFYNCSLDTLIIREGVETIGNEAFRYNSSLRILTLPTSLRTIGDYAFYNCYRYLDTLLIPQGVETIGENAFYYCSALKKIELSSTITSIGKFAFYNLGNLETVISRIQTPFELSGTVFCNSYDTSYNSSTDKYDTTFVASDATLYVPDGKKAAYEAKEGWKMFASIIEGEPKEAAVDGLTYFYLEGKVNSASVIGLADESLKNITIPASVTIDGTSYNVKSIAEKAFDNCRLDTLVVKEGVETIGNYAFRYNYYLKSLTLPTSLRSIGNYAFYNCGSYLQELRIPQGVETIGNYAFNSCEAVNVIELGSSIKAIGQEAFRSMGSLKSVISRIQSPFEISRNVFCSSYSRSYNSDTQVYDTTFTACKATLYVPDGKKSAYEAYPGWTMFASIIEGEPKEATVNGLIYSYLEGKANSAAVIGRADETLKNITIPTSVSIGGASYNVKAIAESALANCSIDTLVVSEGIESIGDRAFYDNYSLKSLTLPTSLRSIGNNAFYYCYSFSNLVIPQGVETIGEQAFYYCNALKRVELGSTVKSIGDRAFYNLSNLKTVVSRIETPFEIRGTVFCRSYNTTWNSDTQQYDTTYTANNATLCVPIGKKAAYQAIKGWTVFADIVEGELIEITSGDLAYVINADRKTATVVNGNNYNKLTKADIPSKVTYEDEDYDVKAIEANAFEGTSIASLTIGEGVETIGQEAFENCRQLSAVSLPSTITTIDEAAFRYCYRLPSITIPVATTKIGDMVFSGCTNIGTMVVAVGNTVYKSQGSNAIIEIATNKLVYGCKNTVIPEGVTEIGFEAFFNCQMTAIQIPSTVETIGQSAFASCVRLKEIVLPEGVDSISFGAFNDCQVMKMVQLPNSLRFIGELSFANCNSLENVVSYIEEPADIDSLVFGENEQVYKQAKLWVPKGNISDYQAKTGWKRFTQFDELLGDILTKPTISYNGRYLVLTVPAEERADIYYSSDGSDPSTLYTDSVAIYNIGVVKAISKRFGSFTVDTASYNIQYVYDGVTAKTAVGGVLAKAFEWCGTDDVETLAIVGELNDDDFETIRSFDKLNTLNMSTAKMSNDAIPDGAFANTKLVWFVAPDSLSYVGSGIFKGCQLLSAITWNSSTVELPEDIATDVANPNMLVYATTLAMIPYSMKNVVIRGMANNIILADSAGNNNFYCPESFIARRISYTHNYQQKTSIGKSQGWETLALPFTVSSITHETNGELTPIAVDGAARPFWLYELGDNGLEAATQIKAHIPYVISMPNDDAYGDEYIMAGRVTFSAQNVQINTSRGVTVSNGSRRFVPTYQRVDASPTVYALNVGKEENGNAPGSAFIANSREVRPFEAYSVHIGSGSRVISLSSLGGGDATGIFDAALNGESDSEIVKVHTLSGVFLKQGPRGEVLHSLPKGVYIINGKKVIK